MENYWLRERRKQLDLNQADLAARLQVAGFNIDRASISHWEVGRHQPPLDNPDFRKALAQALKVSVPTLLKMAGYEVTGEFSEEAREAAEIVDQLRAKDRRLALDILRRMLKEG